MNSRQVKALVVGATVGAVIGGFYAVVLVTYRDMVAQRQAEAAGTAPPKPCKPCEEKAKARELAESPELTDAERAEAPPQFVKVQDRARAIRAEHPGMTWPEAMKAAANKNGSEPAPATTEATE